MKKIFIIFFSLPFLGYSQDKSILDSLRTGLKNANHDSTRVELYMNIIREVYVQNPDTILPLSNKIISLIDGILPELSKTRKPIYLAQKASAYNNLGAYYNQKGHIQNALIYFHKSLRLKEELKEDVAIAKTLNNIGYIYEITGELDNALSYYHKSLKIKVRMNDMQGIAKSLSNIGSIYDTKGDTTRAMINNKKSLLIFRKIESDKDIALVLNNIAFIYDKRKNYSQAEKYFLESLAFRESINDPQGIAESCVNLGALYFSTGKNSEASKFAEQAFKFSNQIGFPEYIRRSAQLLKDIYLKAGNYKKAIEMYDLYILMKDSIVNTENREAAVKDKFQYKYEVKSAGDSIRNLEQRRVEEVKHENEVKRQRFYMFGGIFGFILMLVIAIVSYRAFRIKTRSEKLINQQKEIIEEKQQEILDSINYAKRIQTSFLASDSELKKHFKENFIVYKPKDIVSGDFYWCEKVGNRIYFALCDCTGHGIPGAFMSLLNISLLNEAVLSKRLTQPDEIFDFVRQILIRGLNKNQNDSGNDGMDGVLFCIDTEKPDEITYAGANNSPLVFSNGNLVECDADHMPVGKSPLDKKSFSLFTLKVKKGDTLFIFTDGYPDQFGGLKGKKFKYSNLQKLILENSNKSMEEQKTILDNSFLEWKGDLEQVDDVCVIGIRI